MRRFISPLISLAMVVVFSLAGCASAPTPAGTVVFEQGLNLVRLEPEPSREKHTHPILIPAKDIGALLRGVRVWERRNWLHRLFAGQAVKSRAFRDEEIALLAPAVSKALAASSPSERVSFHLAQATEAGEEETTAGWVFVRDPVLHLVLTEVHDRHGPGPDITKYDRQMPDVREASPAFDVTFEPEDFLIGTRSAGRWFAPVQEEEVQIDFRKALSVVPAFPIAEPPTNHERSKP